MTQLWSWLTNYGMFALKNHSWQINFNWLVEKDIGFRIPWNPIV